VNYAEAESMWIGQTPKNVARLFRTATEQGAVLFFDEADAIATRRATGSMQPYDREMNLTVNVMLRELESFNGIAIFATNLAANFDPAFERRIRTHVLFEMPGVEEREVIWMLQIHPTKTPLADDVDFRTLAERYEGSGGDIKNAVIKAAVAAAAEPGSDFAKRISQRHFETAMKEVMAARGIMQQSLMAPRPIVPELEAIARAGSGESRLWLASGVSLVLAALALVVAMVAVWVAAR